LRALPHIIKFVYDTLISSIILIWEKTEIFFLKSEAREDCPLSSLLFIIVLEFLSQSNNTKEIKGIQTRKEKVNLPFLQMM
jgi:hypothetical protein